MKRLGSSPPTLCTCGHQPDEHLMSYGMCAQCVECYRFELDEDR